VNLNTLADLRREILECNRCFKDSPYVRGCWHHEDLLGGYDPGRIVLLTINAQRPHDEAWDGPQPKSLRKPDKKTRRSKGLEIYRQIRSADWDRKARFADVALSIFAGRDPGGFRAWAEGHPGISRWLPRACTLLLGSDERPNRILMAEHFAIVDIYKHATPSEAHLRYTSSQHPELERCPTTWLPLQLEYLRPELVLLCGASVIAAAVALWGLCPADDADLVHRTGVPHGRKWRMNLYGRSVTAMTAFALADRPAQFHWPAPAHAAGTAAIRSAVAEAISLRRGAAR
jgi:hypothetical protein